MSLVIHCVTGVTVTGVTLWITPVKVSISGLCMSLVIHCVTGVTVTGVTLWITPVKISISGLMYVTDDSLCHWCYCHWCHLPYG